MLARTKTRDQERAEFEQLEHELSDYQLYKHKIKNNCFMCGVWYKNTWNLYQVYGNCCPICSGRVISVLFCSKQRTKSPLTREEASALLAARRNWVVENQLNLPPHKRRRKTFRERVKEFEAKKF